MPRGRVHFALSLALIYCGLLNSIFCKAQTTPKWDINPVLSRRMPSHLQKIEADNNTLAHKWDINPVLSRRMPPHLQKIEADNDTLAHKWDINPVLSRRMPPHLQKIEADNDTLAHKLLEALLRESPRKNIIFSPMSISTSLAKLSLENKSTVFTDLLKDLGFDLKDIRKWDVHQLFQKLHQLDRNIELKHGDILFVGKNRKMDSTFLHKLKNTLGMKVHMVNFQDEEKTKKKINHHVAEKMQEKIDELATDLDPHTLLFLVNYILFKGIWEKAFQANLTQEDFFVDEKTIVPVDMMKKTELMIYKRSEELSATMVKMLCKGNVSVVLVLPDVRQSESALQEILSKRAELMKSGDTRLVHIVMPRLKISSKINLRKLIPVLGIENLFTPKANLLGITKDHLPAILEAVHEARVEVSEEGVAVDAAKHVDEKAALPKAWTASPIVVKFNRPFFLFVQNEKTQKELFVGKVFNPK
ncbi:uteroferrin-associated basic protein 2-like [Manis pentadactyla]|uniref:uteroferrin-associated basic protein 2-like n=1 Tax=Manis pentadactyla TaxID=143292 RepID=UPI00255C5551|nr:uteroferrin-associated basic protein 2-like [Manis pentadactyla]